MPEHEPQLIRELESSRKEAPMNEQEPRPRNPDPPLPEIGADGPTPSEFLRELLMSTDDPELLWQWNKGIDQWGSAFIAFARVGPPELRTRGALAGFERRYVGKFTSIDEVADTQREAMGWTAALRTFRDQQGITEEMLDWNHNAVIRRLFVLYSIVRIEGEFHVFFN